MRDYGLNDAMSSWYCGMSIYYDFCDDPYGKSCEYGKGVSGAGNIRTTRTGNNDELTLLVLSYYDPLTDVGAATLFYDGSCTGTSGRFFAHPDFGTK